MHLKISSQSSGQPYCNPNEINPKMLLYIVNSKCEMSCCVSGTGNEFLNCFHPFQWHLLLLFILNQPYVFWNNFISIDCRQLLSLTAKLSTSNCFNWKSLIYQLKAIKSHCHTARIWSLYTNMVCIAYIYYLI